MRQLIGLLAVGMLLSVGSAHAQVQVQVNFPLPVVRFEAPPPVVMIEPGIQVVQDYDEEVFLVDGAYWVRRDDRWYRSPNHRGGWVLAPPPPRIVTYAPGRYRKFHKAERREEKHEQHSNGHKRH